MKKSFFYWMLSCVIFVGGSLNTQAATDDPQRRVDNVNNEQIIRDFIAAWSRLDAAELVSYFTADGTYYNMPIAPVSGHAQLQEFIQNFLKSWDKTEWEILNIVAQGDLVIAERMDRTVVAGRKVDLPCVGVFEMQQGKIKVWRDYFDLATFTKGAQ